MAAGMSLEQAEQALVVGPGWIRQIEQGEVEPTLNTLAAVVHAYGSDLASLFAGFDIGDDNVTIDRYMSAVEMGNDLLIQFPMGTFNSEVLLENASLDQMNEIVLLLRNGLAVGEKRNAVVECFLKAVELWPDLNPSDLWYFLVSHAYQDPYNHRASDLGLDLAQSWKRTSGWALEAVILQHYNEHLATHGIHLEMPKPERKRRLLEEMGVIDVAGADKADVLVVGEHEGRQEAFGVVHVKASFAERRTDDVPLSQQLIAKGFASPLLTMDCKATPSAQPVNRGELGDVQARGADVSAKRLDIERDRKFDACFSFNARTKPTPRRQAASARIYVVDFSEPNDAFSKYLVRKWKDRRGS
ncbi:hypothetical protein GCM10027265_18010 [Jatrophihabitans fulvus]